MLARISSVWPAKLGGPPTTAVLAQVVSLCIYSWIVLHWMEVFRIPYAFTVAVSIAMLTDVALGLILEKKFRIPWGAFIAGASTFLLLQSRGLWGYALAATAGQLSKKFIRFEGRQFFNPSDLGLLVAVYLLPEHAASVPGQWYSGPLMISAFAIIGLTVSFLAGRSTTVLAYISSYLVVCLARSCISGAPALFFAGTLIGIPQILFACHMVTDPKSSPSSMRGQLAFGAAVGLLDAGLRWNNILYAPFWALLFACAAVPLVSIFSARNLKLGWAGR